jgi:hypothetical protein
MSHDPLPSLQFDRALYEGSPTSLEHCHWCSRGIDHTFFRANGEMICSVCMERVRPLLPVDDRQTFWRAFGTGAVTALGTSLVYLLLFQWMDTHGMGIGVAFGAIGVGYAIGWGMRWAARGAGGRRYQWTAAVLTYMAVAAAMTAAMMGTRDWPLWAYPIFVFAPFLQIFVGQTQAALLELTFAAIGIRWAWMMLQPHGLRLTGPETLRVEPPTPRGE